MSAAWVEAVEGAATIWSDPRSGEVGAENAIAISQGCDVSASTGTASPQRSGARSNPSERMLIPSYIPMTQPSESQTHRSPLKHPRSEGPAQSQSSTAQDTVTANAELVPAASCAPGSSVQLSKDCQIPMQPLLPEKASQAGAADRSRIPGFDARIAAVRQEPSPKRAGDSTCSPRATSGDRLRTVNSASDSSPNQSKPKHSENCMDDSFSHPSSEAARKDGRRSDRGGLGTELSGPGGSPSGLSSSSPQSNRSSPKKRHAGDPGYERYLTEREGQALDIESPSGARRRLKLDMGGSGGISEHKISVVGGGRTRERLVVFGGVGGDRKAGDRLERDERPGEAWREGLRDGIGFGGSGRRSGLSVASGRSGQSEVSDINDLSHAESEMEGLQEGGEGACEYLVRTATRSLLELQGAIEAEVDLNKCEEAIGMIHEAAQRFEALRGRLVAMRSPGVKVRGSMRRHLVLPPGGGTWGGADGLGEGGAVEEEGEEEESLHADGDESARLLRVDGNFHTGEGLSFAGRRGAGRGGVAWEVDVGDGPYRSQAGVSREGAGRFLEAISLSDDESAGVECGSREGERIRVTRRRDMEEYLGGVDLGQGEHRRVAALKDQEGPGGAQGKEGGREWSPHYSYSEHASSPFGAQSFLSGFSGDGSDYGFFPPLPPGEGDMLEGHVKEAGARAGSEYVEDKENVAWGAANGQGGEGWGLQENNAGLCFSGMVSRQASTVSCASGGSSSYAVRSLHDKLMSPERHRRQRPDEVQRKHDEKLRLALERKEALEAQRQERLRGAEQLRQEKLRQLRERRENFQCHMDQKLLRAQEQRQRNLMEKQMKAQKEHSKVSGVKEEQAFIEQLNAESKNLELQQRLDGAEARRAQTLEAAARSSEKAAREEAARQRRLQIKGEKLLRLESRRHRIGLGGGTGCETPVEGAGDALTESGKREGEVEEEADRCDKETHEGLRHFWGKQRIAGMAGGDGVREDKEGALHSIVGEEDRSVDEVAVGEVGGFAAGEKERKSTQREEAARARRREIEEERLKKIHEREEKLRKRSERQQQMVSERMVTLASKEARLRSQAQQLSRLTAEMQADADQQREALEARLQAVLERKKRYMQHIIAKAHAASELRSSLASEPDGQRKVQAQVEEDTRPRKATRKRLRKFRQRLLSIRAGWREAVDGEDDGERIGKGLSGGGSRVSRLLSDLVKSAPRKEDLDEELGADKASRSVSDRGGGRHASRDTVGMDNTLQELLRVLTGERDKGEHDTRVRDVGGSGTEVGAGGDELDRESMLVMVRKSGAIAALTHLLGAAGDHVAGGTWTIECALRILQCACELDTNRLYLIATGRLLVLVNLAETHIHVPSWRQKGQDMTLATQLHLGLAESCVRVLGACLSEPPRTSAQLQARDDLIGYLVNTNLLARVERLIIWGTQALGATVIAWEESRGEAGGGHDRDAGGQSGRHEEGILRSEQRLLGYAVSLLQAVTTSDTLGHREHEWDRDGPRDMPSRGRIIGGVLSDEGVHANLTASLQACGIGGVVPLLSSFFLDSRVVSILRWRGGDDGTSDGWCPVSRWGARCALEALKVLTNVARIDLALLQRMIGSVAVQVEFSHLALQVLRICGGAAARDKRVGAGGGALGVDWCVVGDPPPANSSAGRAMTRILDEMVLLLGYLATPTAVGGASSVLGGWRNVGMVIRALCELDVSYFISPARREVLLPSLVTATLYNAELLPVMEESVSCQLVQQYLESYLAAHANAGVISTATVSGEGGVGLLRHWHSLPPVGVPSRFHLSMRLGFEGWGKAVAFYTEAQERRAVLRQVTAGLDMAQLAAGVPVVDAQEGEEEEGDDERGEASGKIPTIRLSEAEVLSLSQSLSSCASGHEGVSGGGGGLSSARSARGLSSGHEGVLSGAGGADEVMST